jgi:hypothetical protein
MKTILEIHCAWCGLLLGIKDGQGCSGATHGICSVCLKRINEESKDVKNAPVVDKQTTCVTAGVYCPECTHFNKTCFPLGHYNYFRPCGEFKLVGPPRTHVPGSGDKQVGTKLARYV